MYRSLGYLNNVKIKHSDNEPIMFFSWEYSDKMIVYFSVRTVNFW